MDDLGGTPYFRTPPYVVKANTRTPTFRRRICPEAPRRKQRKNREKRSERASLVLETSPDRADQRWGVSINVWFIWENPSING